MKIYGCFIVLISQLVWAHPQVLQSETVISDLSKLRASGAFILSADEALNIGVAHATPEQLSKISATTHFQGKCAGFEVLSPAESLQAGTVLQNLTLESKRQSHLMGITLPVSVEFNQAYKDLAEQASPQDLKSRIEWLSSYPNRYNKSANPNVHVEDLKIKISELLKKASWTYEISMVSHSSTKQKTLKVVIPGKLRPNEIVVLGGHLDSINQSYFGSDKAPGADDNASGSANLIEALKLLTSMPQPDRTWEFYWYAGEESGLLGSAEIAKEYKSKNKNVIAVLQLDMTLYPGSGEQVIGQVEDFTNPWLREVLSRIYGTYFNATFISDECGYACSDHASWHRQGYPAVTPFESTTSTMNEDIHTEKDIINSKSSFSHSNTFTKLAVLFALTLGNSDLKQPFLN